MEKGYLSLVLHAHLPFVHHPESETYIEERWFFEALTETYIPLLLVFENLIKEEVSFRITMSLTPTLLTMMNNSLLQQRYTKYLDNLIALAEKEVNRTTDQQQLNQLAQMYMKKFKEIRQFWIKFYSCNIIEAFKKFQDLGYLELITSSATHSFLPYVMTEQSLRAQIENAVDVHQAFLGKRPTGIWLPECGYHEKLNKILQDNGLKYFFTETHGVLHASPKPVNNVYAPVKLSNGIAAFARDEEASKQVWSSKEGYPGDVDYREYYRDIGYDLDFEYVQNHLPAVGIRLNTGIKYYRITGNEKEKELYHPDWAMGKAVTHAGNFMFNREKQVEQLSTKMDRKPLVVASYDAELFGHWWYEGPAFIDILCRKIFFDQQSLKMVTPTEYLIEYPENQRCDLSLSSWGRGGYGEVWLGESNQWIYRHLHMMEEQMISLADRYPKPTDLENRALNQAARELLLAQSSDWAFIMDNQTMVDYAVKRFKNHLGRFKTIYDALMGGKLKESWMEEVEKRDLIFPNIDFHRFQSLSLKNTDRILPDKDVSHRLKVLMLSWEFPPMTVGGLSRHVFDLARKLVEQGVEIHVVTCHVDGYPNYERNQGIHVHRVRTYQAKEMNFLDWVFQLNVAMVDYGSTLIENFPPFHILHAHDWLVGYAAKELKHHFNLPLVATIHATEYGRNGGIHTDLQRTIHQLEWELTYEAWRVIGCSNYMEEEIRSLFELPQDKVDIIPNGVDPRSISVPNIIPSIRNQFAYPHEKIVFYIGRLVQEKGVQVLIKSIPHLVEQVPDVKIVIAGKGPMEDELKKLAKQLGVENKVLFAGFIEDEIRSQLYSAASVAVFPSLYEPFGIVALEAMAAEIPVVVSGVGGLQEIIQYGEEGFTVLPGDVHSLSLHINKILMDEKLAAAMGRKARDKVMNVYNWDLIAKKTLTTYYNILKQIEKKAFDEQVAVSEG